jgi:Flp pilus assembly protein TadG
LNIVGFRRLAVNKQGLATIELALVAPVLALIAIGVVDLSNAFNHKLMLEQGAQRAIEKIMQTTGTTTVEGALATEAVCQVNGHNGDGSCRTSPLTTSNVVVTFRLECISSAGVISAKTSTSSSTFDAFTCNSGTVKEARYIQIALTDKYIPMFPARYFGSRSDGAYYVSAVAGMRTK